MSRFSDTQALVAYAMRVLATSPQAAAIVHAVVPYSLPTHNSLGRMLGAVKAICKGGGRADAQGQHGALASARGGTLTKRCMLTSRSAGGVSARTAGSRGRRAEAGAGVGGRVGAGGSGCGVGGSCLSASSSSSCSQSCSASRVSAEGGSAGEWARCGSRVASSCVEAHAAGHAPTSTLDVAKATARVYKRHRFKKGGGAAGKTMESRERGGGSGGSGGRGRVRELMARAVLRAPSDVEEVRQWQSGEASACEDQQAWVGSERHDSWLPHLPPSPGLLSPSHRTLSPTQASAPPSPPVEGGGMLRGGGDTRVPGFGGLASDSPRNSAGFLVRLALAQVPSERERGSERERRRERQTHVRETSTPHQQQVSLALGLRGRAQCADGQACGGARPHLQERQLAFFEKGG